VPDGKAPDGIDTVALEPSSDCVIDVAPLDVVIAEVGVPKFAASTPVVGGAGGTTRSETREKSTLAVVAPDDTATGLT
jgi:hypothetical protein